MTEGETILRFLKSHSMATIATIQPGSLQPESALIAFAETDKLEIIFESFVNTRKWQNLQHNSRVALVIGWDTKHHITLQYEGQASLISSAKQEHYTQVFLSKDTPCTEAFLRDPRVRLFKVAPSWLRYSDYTGRGVPKIIEKKFTVQGR